jgi:NAD(P)-dependent dehydrogenase (short-subunit alcohol dehydrogenase family)
MKQPPSAPPAPESWRHRTPRSTLCRRSQPPKRTNTVKSTTRPITSGCDRLGTVHQPANRSVTIITGGTRGIGVATAVRLARAGHDLVLGYRDDDSAAEQAAATVQDAGARCVLARADVTREDDVERLFAVAADQLGTVTGLVNNAGATVHIGDLADTPVHVIREVIDVNLIGVILCARQAAKVMSVRHGGLGGAIVNVSSAAVAPGVIRTAIHAAAGDPGRPDRVAGNIPLGRAGEPDEIAPAIAWLLGPEAGYVTGAVLRVAGGL